MYKLTGFIILCFAFARSNALSQSQQAVIDETQSQLESMHLSTECLQQSMNEIAQIELSHDLCGVVGNSSCASYVITSAIEIFMLVEQCMTKTNPVSTTICVVTGCPTLVKSLIRTYHSCLDHQEYIKLISCRFNAVNREVLQTVIDNARTC